MHRLSIAVVEYDIIQDSPEANRSWIEEFIHGNFLDHNVDVIVLPEMFTCGFGKNANVYAEIQGGITTKWMKQMALLTNALVIGSVPIKEHGAVYNRLLAVEPSGFIYSYDKRHLFTYAQENELFKEGNNIGQFEYKGVIIRPIICYDLRFPVWCRNQKDNPYDVLLCVANWPDSRMQAWNILAQSRAVENQASVVLCNRLGADKYQLFYSGQSKIINFKGDVISNKISDNCHWAEIDITEIRENRNKFPFLNDADDFEIKL